MNRRKATHLLGSKLIANHPHLTSAQAREAVLLLEYIDPKGGEVVLVLAGHELELSVPEALALRDQLRRFVDAKAQKQ